MKILLVAISLLSGSLALAAGGPHSGPDLTIIFWQSVNIIILLGGLVYFLKQPIKDHFSAKAKDFVAAAEKAQSARRAAELENKEITVKLSTLQSTSGESIGRAQAEAADLRKSLVAEAESVAARIRKEAEANSQIEALKARAMVREQLVALAMAEARGQIKTKVTGEDHKRLQGDFINNIQAVQQ